VPQIVYRFNRTYTISFFLFYFFKPVFELGDQYYDYAACPLHCFFVGRVFVGGELQGAEQRKKILCVHAEGQTEWPVE
jgi:hypothetical protein